MKGVYISHSKISTRRINILIKDIAKSTFMINFASSKQTKAVMPHCDTALDVIRMITKQRYG